MAKSYVKFEVSEEVAAKTYEALQLAKQSGVIRKGANEVTKSIERGLATFVVIAGDVDPEEVVIHLPTLCEQKKVPYSYVPTKLDLGKSIGLSVPCTAIAVEGQGNAGAAIKDIVSKITGTSSAAKEEPKKEKEAKKEQKPAAPEKKAESKPQTAEKVAEKAEKKAEAAENAEKPAEAPKAEAEKKAEAQEQPKSE